MLDTTPTAFHSNGTRCAAWLTRAEGNGPRPAILLVHGFGATHEMGLARYEQAFAHAGYTTLAFDFRHIGESDGEPRQVIATRRQLVDVEAALTFLRADANVDAQRIALWGTSLGATHALLTAARHPELAAVLVQCPIVSGRNAALRAGWRASAKLVVPMFTDAICSLVGARRRYLPIVGAPGERAIVTIAGARQGWESLIPDGYQFDNRVVAAAGFGLASSNAARRARKIRSPLLVCISDRESLMDPRIASRAARRAPFGEARHYDADHFDVYHPPLFDAIVADQIAFLRRHIVTHDGSARVGRA